MSPRPWIPRDLNEPPPGTPTSQSDKAINAAYAAQGNKWRPCAGCGQGSIYGLEGTLCPSCFARRGKTVDDLDCPGGRPIEWCKCAVGHHPIDCDLDEDCVCG